MTTLDYADKALDFVIPMTLANKEYALVLPEETKAVEIQAREAVDIFTSFKQGAVDTASPPGPFRTIKSGSVLSKNYLNLNATTLYVACASSGKNVEVRVWL